MDTDGLRRKVTTLFAEFGVPAKRIAGGDLDAFSPIDGSRIARLRHTMLARDLYHLHRRGKRRALMLNSLL